MDDEDELRELNLSSRPRREERRRQRERNRLEREVRTAAGVNTCINHADLHLQRCGIYAMHNTRCTLAWFACRRWRARARSRRSWKSARWTTASPSRPRCPPRQVGLDTQAHAHACRYTRTRVGGRD